MSREQRAVVVRAQPREGGEAPEGLVRVRVRVRVRVEVRVRVGVRVRVRVTSLASS